MTHPWFKFYPSDWRADPRLRMCSLAARGLWIDLIGFMHEGEPYGHLTVHGEMPTVRDIAALVGRPFAEVNKALVELEIRQVLSRLDNGVIYSRRMVRDKAKAEQDKNNGKGGGNPKLRGQVKGGVNPPDKAQIPEARNQNPESKKGSEANASGAEAPTDHRHDLFNRGLETLSRLTGKGPDACRSFVGKCLSAAGDDAVVVLGLIEDAERNRVVNPSAWISARLKATGPPVARAATVYQQRQQESREILNEMGKSIAARGGTAHPFAIRHDSGDGRPAIRGGLGENVIDIPAITDRSRG